MSTFYARAQMVNAQSQGSKDHKNKFEEDVYLEKNPLKP